MTSKEYFEGVRQSRVRADELNTRAEELKKHAGDARGMRYERPIIGRQKNGAVYIDAMSDAIQRLQKASVAAYSASELAMTYVAEAGEVLETMLESSDADVTAIAILWDYYIDGKTDESISYERGMSQSGVCRARQRGLRKSEPYLRKSCLL